MYFHDRYKGIFGGSHRRQRFGYCNHEKEDVPYAFRRADEPCESAVYYHACDFSVLHDLSSADRIRGMTMRIYPCLGRLFHLFLMYAEIIIFVLLNDMKGCVLTALVFCLVTMAGSLIASEWTGNLVWSRCGGRKLCRMDHGIQPASLDGKTSGYSYISCNGHLLKKKKRLSVSESIRPIRKIGKDRRYHGRHIKGICNCCRGIHVLKAILSSAKRKMTEHFCLAWAFLAALMVLAGILLNPVQLDNFISFRGLILVILLSPACSGACGLSAHRYPF